MTSLSEKGGNATYDLQCNVLVVGVAGFGPHLAVALPVWPRPQQQSLFITGANEVLKDHLVVLCGGRRGESQIALKHLVADFVGELKPLNQSVADLDITDLPVVTRQAFF